MRPQAQHCVHLGSSSPLTLTDALEGPPLKEANLQENTCFLVEAPPSECSSCSQPIPFFPGNSAAAAAGTLPALPTWDPFRQDSPCRLEELLSQFFSCLSNLHHPLLYTDSIAQALPQVPGTPCPHPTVFLCLPGRWWVPGLAPGALEPGKAGFGSGLTTY